MESNIETKRHSLAHLMAMAITSKHPNTKLGIGPAIENGFYYDFDFPESDHSPSEEKLPVLEGFIKELIAKDIKFEKEEISADEARKIFASEPYKLELIDELAKNSEKISVYKSCLSADGPEFVDLCAGPHVESTKEINPESFKLTKIAGAYWKGNEKNQMLTRIYGVAFETKEELVEYLKKMEEAEKRDHRKIGKELDLFMFHETAPGMPYWLSKGLIVYKELENYWRVEHAKLGYKEIASPLVNKSELWKISGHWDHYKEDMFIADMGENEIYGIKPMNCPNAMLVFKNMQISYRDLPLRLSDTDRLHRYEKSGTLNGLLRCRSFQQDDSHNFITEEMIGSEYEHIMNVCKNFYGIFGLEYRFRLGTRPENFLGDKETWDTAEKKLKEILEKSNKNYSVAEGDGAFYGPKVDIIMKDCLGRDWQMGTMQLDFQLPRRFELSYTDRNGQRKTPVVIHRVVYGSLERFIGILIEHYAGAFPLWLAPIQAVIIPVSEKFSDYGKKVLSELRQAGIRAELDNDNETLGKRIRNSETKKIPYILVVGEKEAASDSVAVRSRKGPASAQSSAGKDEGAQKITDFIKKIQREILEKE